jgi:hypothetical protein
VEERSAVFARVATLYQEPKLCPYFSLLFPNMFIQNVCLKVKNVRGHEATLQLNRLGNGETKTFSFFCQLAQFTPEAKTFPRSQMTFVNGLGCTVPVLSKRASNERSMRESSGKFKKKSLWLFA